MTLTISTAGTKKSWFSQWSAVVAVFVISILASCLAWQYETKRVLEENQLQFEREAQILREDIINTVNAYAQFLRGGVGLVHASNHVSRAEWHQFVIDARLGVNYPGIQGVSINAFLEQHEDLDAFLAHVRATDWPGYRIMPQGRRDAYAPVLFLEPLSQRNERAIGYDIYSEQIRRNAVDIAVATGEPTMTAKITLIQEEEVAGRENMQAGVLLILPTFALGVAPDSASEKRANTTGLIVSVFRMGDLVDSVFAKRGGISGERIRLNLYDAPGPEDGTQLYGDRFDAEPHDHTPLFRRVVSLNVYGRDWTFEMMSTLAFEENVASSSPLIVLGAGTLLSLLLTSLVFGQSQRTHETEATAEKLAANQQHIELLMGEVNHRSKNLLSLVQAIARQTKADDPSQFVSQFSERVRALAASQDLLVKNSWKGISLNDLIDSQLGHFEGLLGNRIQLNGPDIDITAEASQTLGMAFHELATNAGKYGALSNDVGTVDIEWRLTDVPGPDGQLFVSWLESGGPPVVPPTRTGFGSKVTDMMVKFALDGRVDSTYEPSGFAWHLACPTRKVFETQTKAGGPTLKSREAVV